ADKPKIEMNASRRGQSGTAPPNLITTVINLFIASCREQGIQPVRIRSNHMIDARKKRVRRSKQAVRQNRESHALYCVLRLAKSRFSEEHYNLSL
ncbi:MAG: hypothetical protein MPJ78_20345, partial [Hyphomicrobiaceae bacterium]|nr:hypothetical protein [Hyphomicrobiaceae bacterium]